MGVFFSSWTDSNISIQIYFLGKTRVPNVTFEWLLSFMNWFSICMHYSDDVIEKKLCHNDLQSFLRSRTDLIRQFRTCLNVRNFCNNHCIWITLHQYVHSDIFLEKKLHHRHCIYIGVVSFIKLINMSILIFIFRKSYITNIYVGSPWRVLG